MARADRAPERVEQRWEVGPYTLEEVSGHGFPQPAYPRLMYRYKINGQRVDSEMYRSLDRALVSAVGAQHTGPRSASGPGVGTAADWFCVMVGLDEHEQAPADGLEQAVDQLSTVARDGGAPDSERCAGSEQVWRAESDTLNPVCRQCGATPAELGVARPERRFNGFSFFGLVPLHESRAA